MSAQILRSWATIISRRDSIFAMSIVSSCGAGAGAEAAGSSDSSPAAAAGPVAADAAAGGAGGAGAGAGASGAGVRAGAAGRSTPVLLAALPIPLRSIMPSPPPTAPLPDADDNPP